MLENLRNIYKSPSKKIKFLSLPSQKYLEKNFF